VTKSLRKPAEVHPHESPQTKNHTTKNASTPLGSEIRENPSSTIHFPKSSEDSNHSSLDDPPFSTGVICDITNSSYDKNTLCRPSDLHDPCATSPDVSVGLMTSSSDVSCDTNVILNPGQSLLLKPPSQEERMTMYKFLDDNIGPACGVEESVGTYRMYMKEQSRLYFAHLFPDSHEATAGADQSIGSGHLGTRYSKQLLYDHGDFRNWLSCTHAPATEATATVAVNTEVKMAPVTPLKRIRHDSSGSTASCLAPGLTSPSIGNRDDRTLDDLFPKPIPFDHFPGDNRPSFLPSDIVQRLSPRDGKKTLPFSHPVQSNILSWFAESRSPTPEERRIGPRGTSRLLYPRYAGVVKSHSWSLKALRQSRHRKQPHVLQDPEALAALPMLTDCVNILGDTRATIHLHNCDSSLPCSVPSLSSALGSKRARPRPLSTRLRAASAGGGI
jgi:hypothetical protein